MCVDGTYTCERANSAWRWLASPHTCRSASRSRDFRRMLSITGLQDEITRPRGGGASSFATVVVTSIEADIDVLLSNCGVAQRALDRTVLICYMRCSALFRGPN
jgi:hypothetical protein